MFALIPKINRIIALSVLMLFCSTAELTFGQTNTPAITSLSPTSATTGGPAFTLIVDGSDFNTTSIVRWDGANRPTTFISRNQLSAAIPATDLAVPGTVLVTVLNGGLSVVTSNSAPFTINPPTSPVPTLSSVNPSSALAGGPGLVVTLSGANFNNSSIVRWNNTDRQTTFISANQLTAVVTATDIAMAGNASLTVFNPSPGGGSSNALPFTISQPPNAVPAITSLNPNSETAGNPGFTITVTGTNFGTSSTVRWNGADRPTNFVSPSQLVVSVSAADIAGPGTFNVTVFNPPPGGGASNALAFNVNPPISPAPVLNSMNPPSVVAGGAAFILTVNGANFNATSTVRWNNVDRQTTFNAPNQLTAVITASDIADAGMPNVTVFNPAPGGGSSNALPFIIEPKLTPAPVLGSLSPNSTIAGSAAFQLTITGSGFTSGSEIRWNGAARPTTFISPNQLLASIFASDVATTGLATVSVFVPLAGPGGATTNTLPFTIVGRSLSLPTLTSVSSNAVAQGASKVRLILVGANFRPGAQVVISQSESSSLPVPSTDIVVESVMVISDTTIVAVIGLSEQASIGVRRVDVVNSDNSNTGPGGSRTSQSLRVEPATSLAAPLAVRNIVITYPRNGTVVAQGDQLFAEAILAGVGTGTITGQWVWDGYVTEQFVANFNGSGSITVKTSNSLPTILLGLHVLELRITSPNTPDSDPLRVVVNPGSWKQMHLIAPDSGRGFATEAPPLLRWSIVPGAVSYQIGFASGPFFSKITRWYDVEDTQWQVPEKIWSNLPQGELYWTVRAVELAKITRQPALMRRIFHIPTGALGPLPVLPLATTAGHAALQWNGLNTDVVYRVTFYLDADAKQVARRVLTSRPYLDFPVTADTFQPGKTYYWRVEAFSTRGSLIFVGGQQPYIAPSPVSSIKKRNMDQGLQYERASLRVPTKPVLNSPEGGALLVNRNPEAKQIVRDARPTISMEFTAKAVSNFSVLLDNTDVTALCKVVKRKATFRPVFPLAAGEHEITVNSGSEIESWKFTVERKEVVQSERVAQGGADAEVEPESGLVQTSPNSEQTSKSYAYEVSSHAQWVSGAAVDNDLLSLAAQMSIQHGPWGAEVNGTGLVNSLFNPRPRHVLTQFNDYVLRLSHRQKRWGSDLRFGTIAPLMYVGADFISTAYPRQGTEGFLRTRAGSFSFYSNAFDSGGEGAGDDFRQQVRGAGYEAPLPAERARFRLTWLGAKDIGFAQFGSAGPGSNLSSPKSGNAFDALFSLHFGKTWTLTSEYAVVSNNLNTQLSQPDHHFGRAWRTALSGSFGKTNINLAYRAVSPDFANPVNASLGQLSASDRRGMDASVVSQTSAGIFTVNYQLLQSDVHRPDRPRTTLNNLTWNWTKNITNNTVVTVGGNAVHTGSSHNTDAGTGNATQAEASGANKIDQRRFALNTSVRQTIGQLTLNVGGSRNWFFDRTNSRFDNVTSALNLSGQWKLGSFFQLQSNYSVNWLRGDKFTFGDTRIMTAYIQPMLNWRRTGLSLSPLLTINQTKARVSDIRISDMINVQYGGRLSWQMPGRMKFSTLSFEGSQNHAVNRMQGTDLKTPRLAIVWTLIRTSKPVE